MVKLQHCQCESAHCQTHPLNSMTESQPCPASDGLREYRVAGQTQLLCISCSVRARIFCFQNNEVFHIVEPGPKLVQPEGQKEEWMGLAQRIVDDLPPNTTSPQRILASIVGYYARRR